MFFFWDVFYTWLLPFRDESPWMVTIGRIVSRRFVFVDYRCYSCHPGRGGFVVVVVVRLDCVFVVVHVVAACVARFADRLHCRDSNPDFVPEDS